MVTVATIRNAYFFCFELIGRLDMCEGPLASSWLHVCLCDGNVDGGTSTRPTSRNNTNSAEYRRMSSWEPGVTTMPSKQADLARWAFDDTEG